MINRIEIFGRKLSLMFNSNFNHYAVQVYRLVVKLSIVIYITYVNQIVLSLNNNKLLLRVNRNMTVLNRASPTPSRARINLNRASPKNQMESTPNSS